MSASAIAVRAALAAGITVAVMPVVVAVVRQRLLDFPNQRSSHQVSTPRGGGLAPAAGCVGALVAAGSPAGAARAGLIVAATGFGLIGLMDDAWTLPVSARLPAQAVAAAAALPWLLTGLSGHALWQVVFAAGVWLWLVSYVNAFNFMDGINGISAGQAIVAGAAWFALGVWRDVPVLAVAGAIIAGASAGFLPFNFPRARVFLGDVGSYFLGAWLAATAVFGLRAGLAPEAVLAPLTLYLADTATTIVRRVRQGAHWSAAHRDHTYQRLCAVGWSHACTTVVVTGVMVALAGLGALAELGPLAVRLLVDGAGAAVVVAYLRAPTLIARSGPAIDPSRACAR